MGRFSEMRLRLIAFAIGYGGQWPWWEILVSRRKKLGGTSLDRWCHVSTLHFEGNIEKHACFQFVSAGGCSWYGIDMRGGFRGIAIRDSGDAKPLVGG